MKEEWLFPGAMVPVDMETTAALVAEIKRLIDIVGGLILKQGPDYERGFVDGMSKQAQSSVDKAVNAMAQPAQEPLTDKQRRNMVKKWLFDFAWDDPTERQIDDLEMLLIAGRNSAAHGITPQQRPWIRLTDEEIMRIINSNISTGLWCMAIEIEAKLKEKNT